MASQPFPANLLSRLLSLTSTTSLPFLICLEVTRLIGVGAALSTNRREAHGLMKNMQLTALANTTFRAIHRFPVPF
jgi:hypothetical protein